MKIIKLETKKESKCPTIVKIKDDYYIISKPLNINRILEIPEGSKVAINLENGTWFDFGDEDGELESQMKPFEKGAKFEIEI